LVNLSKLNSSYNKYIKYANNKNMKNVSLRKNLLILIPILILLGISLLNMYGASFISDLYKSNLLRQGIWVIIGLIVMYITYKMDMSLLYKFSTILYILGIAALILVLFIGSSVNGATSWFKIGPISFQPSELFKFFYIIHLARVITETKKESKLTLLKILTLTFIPAILIFLEPDTGVVIMYLLMMFGFIMESGIKKRNIIFMIILGNLLLTGFILLYFFKSDLFIKLFGTSFFYRMDRLLLFKDASSYQLNNALIGIGAAGLTGFGLKTNKIYIPEVVTDFAFDLTILNFGYIIGIIVVLLYTFLLYRIYREINNSKKKRDKLILSAIFYMMLFQVGEHIMMNLGLAPITGITLPFLSYGGSSLISYFMLIGLVMKITTNNSSYSLNSQNRHRRKGRKADMVDMVV